MKTDLLSVPNRLGGYIPAAISSADHKDNLLGEFFRLSEINRMEEPSTLPIL